MFGDINRRVNKMKNDAREHAFMMESVLDTDEVLPGSEDEMEDEVDIDSVPDDVIAAVDKYLDTVVNKPDYDDEEIEETLDDDDEDLDLDDAEIDVVVTEIDKKLDESVHWWNLSEGYDDGYVVNEETSEGSGEEVDVMNGSNDYQEGDHVETEEPDFETTGEAKTAMATNEALNRMRSLLGEDVSYGSGERVEVQNKTNDYQEGDHVKTEEPDFETTADAKRDMAKGEHLYDMDQGSGAGLGYQEGDHAPEETKNPITNESVISRMRDILNYGA